MSHHAATRRSGTHSQRNVSLSLSRLSCLVALLLPSLAVVASARNFTLREDLSGNDFFEAFNWWSYDDPTLGAVDYVTQDRAKSAGLSFVNERGHFVMKADSNTVIRRLGEARQSVRIHSKRKMGDGILVARFHWMPQGCGTWPAFWTCTTDRWPAGGEIDILEGANDQGPRNLASLHTLHGCHITPGTSELHTGVTDKSDCSYQPGCSVRFSEDNTFGPGFNQNGGGWYAMRRDTRAGGEGISVWFWPATTPISSLPAAVAAGADGSAPKYVVTNANATGADRSELDKWGQPAAFFPNIANATASPAALTGSSDEGVCQMENYFEEHEIIINLTFCGDWAGETFGTSGCAAANRNVTCEQFVRENPQAFRDARWEIEYLRTYTDAALTVSGPMASVAVVALAAIALVLL
ncbi:uncharacterized protein PFL1_06309 [Pseudozyma flocculosa PF-1]|uniref:Related to endo-1,3(4)-beta-glucanase n=2 Tax=Pseudozyma flocculosa TaxID=84751 RepID=A0A5C3F8F8_9BASI|nr:uncharacterized protein PFL1_06309 [Pseudozyma flocculosa PF-1]EPQ26101.1 hypothetical protein PFL1_06309 [Pseudozyma flocculosa PF-1]SPO40346.1 related to endo-1,3(4)-beta-glucanase [Pseudozyma flocculosa]